MRIKNEGEGLKVPGAVLAENHPMAKVSNEKKAEMVASGVLVAQALFKRLQPFALTNSPHPAFANL